MTYSVLRQTIVNAMPFVDEFVWNYSENLDWLTPGAGSAGNWQNAVWNARSQLGLSQLGLLAPSAPNHVRVGD